jgi:dipeptidyl-peptidase-4
MPRRFVLLLWLAGASVAGLPVSAQTAPTPSAVPADPSRLTVEQIFASRTFASERAGVQWEDGTHTVSFVRTDGGGMDYVRTDIATGERETLVTSAQMTPAGAAEPLDVEDLTMSPDGRSVLLYTNSARVWRANTRGDYWVLDRRSGHLRQLGGPDARPSTLMFATFSPDGTRVAYVREHDLYVEDVASGAITALTTDGSETTINGTFDWVYEEEFGLRNGFRWSPDGAQIAYWRLDATGVRDFLMINNTDSLYSYTIPVQYPKAGETNSAAKIGVVAATGGPTRWFRL